MMRQRKKITLFFAVTVLIVLGCGLLAASQAQIKSGPAARTGAAAPAVDYSCTADADCAVKNVGNCCGAFPACVNKNAVVDPEGVRARCAKAGLSSICGFTEISACGCEHGRCVSRGGRGGLVDR